MDDPGTGPLTARELRVVRGMIDEYEAERRRAIFWRKVFGTSRTVIAGMAALTVIAVNLVTLIVVLTHH